MTGRWSLALLGALLLAGGAAAEPFGSDPASGERETAALTTVTATDGRAGATAAAGTGAGAIAVAADPAGPTDRGTPPGTAPGNGGVTGAFDRLSPGNRKIARALLEAQRIGSEAGDRQAWSLDRIAAAKRSGRGWGRIVKDMQGAGLVQAKNLGKLVSGLDHGRKFGLGREDGVPGNPADPASAEPWEGGRIDLSDSEPADHTGLELAAGDSPAGAGAFDRLSPGNRKIAKALLEAQRIGPEAGARQAWSLDQIAAAKQSGRGWGRIVKDMQGAGLVQAKSLGEAVSAYKHRLPGGAGGSGVVVTTGSGEQLVFGTGRSGGGHGPGAKTGEAWDKQGDGPREPKGRGQGTRGGLVTAGGSSGAMAGARGAGAAAVTSARGKAVGLSAGGGRGSGKVKVK